MIGLEPSFVVASLKEDMERIMKLLQENMDFLHNSGFYYSKLGGKDAHKMLLDKPDGTFLIRESAHTKCLFSLSYKLPEGVWSQRIHLFSNSFKLEYHHVDKSFRSIRELLHCVTESNAYGDIDIHNLHGLGPPLYRKEPEGEFKDLFRGPVATTSTCPEEGIKPWCVDG